MNELLTTWRIQIMARWRAARQWLTLEGRLGLERSGVLAVALCTGGLALLFPVRWLLYLVYVYLLLLLAAYLWVRSVGPRLRLERRLAAPWAEVGDELEEHWSLHNQAALPLLWLEIDDDSTLPGYNARRVAACEAHRSEHWRTGARCDRRGVYRLGPLTARIGDPLGIVRYSWREEHARQLVVYPPLVRLPPLPLPRGRRGGLAQADLLQLYATPSVGAVRDYTPGDPPGRIHWPFVARHQRLIVKEFDQERAGALWLVLDLAAAAYPPGSVAMTAGRPLDTYVQRSVVSERPIEVMPPSLVDLAVTLTASLAAQVLAEGRTVGLLCDDGRRRLVPPGSGMRQLWQILNELVDSEATGRQSLGDLLRRGWGPREGGAATALVVITAALDGAWLPALSSAGGQPGNALALLVAARPEPAIACAALLAGQGLAAQTFLLGTPLPLLNPPRRRVTARVSPLGRVVRAE